MFFKKNKDKNKSEDLTKVAALLIHAANIDESFTQLEEKIIKETLSKINSNNENINEVIKKAKEIEKNANQILDFTKEVKNMDEQKKIKILETLWRIIYSNNEADIYETNLMRRLGGLLYIDHKLMGDIKQKIKSEIL